MMDKYGSCGLEDAQMIAETLRAHGAVVFCFSLDGVSAYVVQMTSRFQKIGTMSFGGNPLGSVLVGLLHRGCYWFDPAVGIHHDYVGEKLRIIDSDAKNVTKMLNAIFDSLQKGFETTDQDLASETHVSS